MKKNAIIGTAAGYKFPQIEKFVTTLRKINYTGDIVLFVKSNIDSETRKKLNDLGVELVYIPVGFINFSKNYAASRLWKIHYPIHKLIFFLLSLFTKIKIDLYSFYVKTFHQISGSRYCFYSEYLKKNREKYKYILVTDVRDVIFQADPFENLQGEVLKFYSENHTIKESFYTSYWIKNAFGKSRLAKIENNRSICSGTTIGSVELILDYIEKMISKQAEITSGITGLGGFDQGVHNFLIYNNFFQNSLITNNGYGEVITLGEASNIKLNDNEELINEDLSIVPVIHQFDRFPDLKIRAMRD